MKFLDAAFPQSVDAMDQALKHEGAQGFAFYVGGNNTTHAWPASLVVGLLARGYQGASIWVPFPAAANGAADGATAAAWTRAYGVKVAFVDIEAAVVVGARSYCAAWNQTARAGGMVTGGYSTPRGISSDEFDFDLSWAAIPGNCNTAAAPGTPGKRAVQCGSGSWAGVSYDISFSEYDFGGDTVSVDEVRAALNEGTPFGYQSWGQANQDAFNNLRGLVPGVATALAAVMAKVGVEDAEIQQLLAAQGTLGSEVLAIKTELDAVAAGGSTVDLTKVYAQLANLGKHVGVDVTTGADT
jgi:hypothetical protein